jgi:type I restriction enzyme S subunit
MKCEEWKKIALQEIIQFKNGKKRPTENGTVPVYGGNGILGFCNQNNYEKVVAIGRVGAYCGSLYLAKGKCWISDNAIAAQNKTGALLKYIFYLLKWLRLNERHIGTGQPLLTQEILNNIVAVVPEYPEQKAIADTLSCLDDKIELNNRMNHTLEKMAQAIFKSWFMDFEPFQDGEFVDSELGPIPKGWRVGTLTEIADYLNGLAMQKYPPESEAEALPVLKIKELRQGRTDAESDLCAPDIEEKYIIHDGDVVFSWSGSLLVDLWCGGTCGLNQHLFKVTSSKYQKWFYYMWTLYHLREFQAVAKDKATTMGHIKRENLTKSKVLIPNSQVLEDMNSAMSPIIEKIIANRLQSRKLEETRDSLLPKLMSGEIRVPMEAK